MKQKTFAATVLAVIAWGCLVVLTPPAMSIDCSLVRCPGCPDGFEFKPTGGNCCRCVPIKH